MISWHTKYRPQRLADLHLTNVRQTLLQLAKSGRLPQVFLFAGPKGTGKTSASRILAAMVNDQANEALIDHLFFKGPAPKDSALAEPTATDITQRIMAGSSYVIQEMDAASNRGIDDMRALKEKAYLPPQGAKMAVYILDEAHMLTTEAFNALLKLLEEPPPHALFILATTELHKIPETIVSRATLVRFQTASTEELMGALTKVSQGEKLTVEPAALERIAQLANGSFRDGVKLLEQMAQAGKKITLELVQDQHVGPLDSELEQLIEAVLAKNEQQVAQLVHQLRSKGYPSSIVHSTLLHLLHRSLLKSMTVIPGEPLFSQSVSLFLLNELRVLPREEVSPIPLLSLEIKLLELVIRAKQKEGGPQPAKPPQSGGAKVKAIAASKSASAAQPTNVDRANEALENAAKPVISVLSDIIPAQVNLVSADVITNEILSEALDENAALSSDNLALPADHLGEKLLTVWSQFVDKVAEENATVAALLRSARPLTTSNGVARVAVYYQFHKDQLQQPKFLSLIQDCAEPLLGGKPGFEFIVDKPVDTKSTADASLQTLADEVLL